MFSTEDTIVAIATPAGRGGIGIVRISGPAAPEIARSILAADATLRPRYATFARTRSDHVVATWFPAPASYTGEHVVEVAAHGSPLILRDIVEDAMRSGARLAEPGEFTLRAFLNGRIDLVQAEAVADLIEAVSPRQARAAFDQLEGTLTARIGTIDAALFDLIAKLEASLDFPDEGYHFVEAGETGAALRAIERGIDAILCDAKRGRLLRDGARLAIVGKPNVGKSSLFNALLRKDRAIVTSIPGTTRDVLTESAEVDGMKFELTDTAGVRETSDEIESEGVRRARSAWTTADLVLVVLDASRRLDAGDDELLRLTEKVPRLVVRNKTDLAATWTDAETGTPTVPVSAKTGQDIDTLRVEIRRSLEGDTAVLRDTVAVTNVRHISLLERAREALRRAADSVETEGGPVAEEFVLTDVQDARSALEEITGRRTTDDLLRHIFARFCIGK